ncbi:MAG: hypothetical protein M3Y24_01985 [Acidobacteriota bacterium]|nr:hypothetical protein [Acidobacteriota bacterium]
MVWVEYRDRPYARFFHSGALPLRIYMNQLQQQDRLTVADIRVLAASIYEPKPRLWIGARWRCPQCLKLNNKTAVQCGCGISRDGLPEFCER